MWRWESRSKVKVQAVVRNAHATAKNPQKQAGEQKASKQGTLERNRRQSMMENLADDVEVRQGRWE